MTVPPPPTPSVVIERPAANLQQGIRQATPRELAGERLTPNSSTRAKAQTTKTARRIVPLGFRSIFAPVAVVMLLWMIVAGVRSLFWPPKQERPKKLSSKPWKRKQQL